MAIVITDVITEYGAHYINEGQNRDRLTKKLFRPSVTASFFGLRPTKDTLYRVADADIERVLQPFQKAFTPTGTLTMKPNPIKLFNLKVDKQEFPDDIVDAWTGFLEGDGINREEWPFVRWMLEEHIIPRAIEDFELNESFAGVYAAPTPTVAGAAGTAMDGIAQQFTDNAARINVISSGAMPTSVADVVSYIEEWYADIEKEHRKRIDYVFVSEDVHLKYRQGKREKYNMNYTMESDLDRIIDFPNAKVMGLPGMGSSNMVWATPANNRIRPLKKSDNGGMPIVKEYSPREVSIWTDWWTVLGFLRPESIFKNDQA